MESSGCAVLHMHLCHPPHVRHPPRSEYEALVKAGGVWPISGHCKLFPLFLINIIRRCWVYDTWLSKERDVLQPWKLLTPAWFFFFFKPLLWSVFGPSIGKLWTVLQWEDGKGDDSAVLPWLGVFFFPPIFLQKKFWDRRNS